MAISSLSLPLPGLKTAFAEALFNEILSNTNNYYYFIGKALEWTGGIADIATPENTLLYESTTRNEMVFFKKVTPADIAYVIPRHNWISGQVYDKYDNSLGDYITYSVGPSTYTQDLTPATGTFDLSKFGVGWRVSGRGIADDTYVDEATPTSIRLSKYTINGVALSSVTFTKVGVSRPITQVSYGVAASAGVTTLNGAFDVSTFGVGWLVAGEGIPADTYVTDISAATVTISKPTTHEAGSVTFTQISAPSSLSEARFYALTADNVVYKCLDNNNGAASTVKPYSTTHEAFTTSDGYRWKYMYTIPASLINKFMTLYDMPVTTSVKAPYYSNGAIGALRVLNYGADYTSNTEIIVKGDGSRVGNRYSLKAVSVIDGGSGYITPPDVTVADPFDTIPFVANATVAAGKYVKLTDGKVYEVVGGGNLGSLEPTHSGDVSQPNGTTYLKFAGYTPQATATLVDGSITEISLSGIIGYVKLTGIGAGYDPLHPPAVSITGDGTNAHAYARVSPDGRVVGIVISDRGQGYTTASASIAPPPSVTYTAYVSGGSVTAGNVIQYGENLYTVNGGVTTLGTTPPTHTYGSVGGLTYRSKTPVTAEALVEIYKGFGYNTIPAITIDGASASITAEKTEAILTPIIENGELVGVVIVEGGEGYTTATVTTSPPLGAIIEADLSLGDLNTRQANAELLAVPGTVDSIDILHPGTGYGAAPTITIKGDGTGATAVATVYQGAITKITVTNPGLNYTHATVVIGSSGGNQAYARAIVSPIEGHGKNAVKELYAKDLALATTIAQERNMGFIVNNEYRQLGLIKNPTDPTTGARVSMITGSACSVVTGNFDWASVEEDTGFIDSNLHEYYVVARPATDPGVSVSLLISSPDNTEPEIGEILYYNNGTGVNDSNVAAIITGVTLPTVDKYSGELLFIDNRASFKPTDEQTVSIKTVIRL